MKYLILLLMSVTCYAEEVPKWLQDGTIVVTLKDGRSYEYSTNAYKVVRRGEETAEVTAAKKEQAARKTYNNTIHIYGGYGPRDIKSEAGSNSVKVSTESGFIYGGGYSRRLNDRFSVDAVGLSNGSALGGLGVSF